MKVFLLHPGKANYPEIAAYSEYFKTKYNCEFLVGKESDFEKIDNKRDYVVWCIMGFYPNRIDCKKLIHDYRSLSVGRFCALKDIVKRFFNASPDLRIFQNEKIEKVMGFKDGVKSILIPMGVPAWIFEINKKKSKRKNDLIELCYIGEMSVERKFDKLLDSYVAWANNNAQSGIRTDLVLVGTPDESIFKKYSSIDSIKFAGRHTQRDALQIVKNSDFSICYFPYHRPHKYQTPTKLLEYAALGGKIICNDSPSNLDTINLLKLNCLVTGKNIFDDLDIESIYSIRDEDGNYLKERISWGEVLDKSGLYEVISDMQ
ncbi:glycosyltransferase family protein [Quatrionicoccus australiensis]|uniref:hypothetical protein n=1 Tax=Quatrionicoccus australiensis TaxID=138118 RepID=UPI001CFACF8D|nr:hypothetical protein [Quatrionicoccus australiensis]MCB4358670.1 glycosyltransferase [Quatrionicoccus australiensis]